MPVKEILERLGLPPFTDGRPQEGPPPPEAQPDAAPAQGSPMDPSALISPVTDALGTLGNGLFEGVDPTAMLQGISQAFQSTGSSLKPALSSVDDAWQGASGTTAAAKTATAIANGADVGAQSETLKGNLTSAATNVAQARARLIEIIAEFQATMAAIGPSIIFPWGWAAAIAAANKAVASTAEVMTELQTSLGAQAAEVTAAGAPVDVTAAPQLAASSPISSLASPLMSMATKGAQAGIQAGTGAASAASQAAQQAPTGAEAAAGVGGPPIAAPGAGGGGGVGGGGAGGGGGSSALRSMATSTMVQPETAATAQSASVRASGGPVGSGGAGMMGGGAPYGPMAGQGANGSSNTHTAAAFLHTTDQGGAIVGDLGTAAPPVLGEADPTEPPDIELRI
ncbi:hypothetical protein [Mycobacterium sp. URHB0044]|uniref:hypothetical protein n=1 Tax=Mycobacterium sp. URHB0044 TaxID=1380386 RepID=UPI0012DCD35B|nr:hypothetical protein [Mycobacterium sp. URHB0044]